MGIGIDIVQGEASCSLDELRRQWATLWGMEPPLYLGRAMLVKSIAFKQRQDHGQGLTPEQQKQLATLMKAYRRNPKSFAQDAGALKPGMRLIRMHNDLKHSILVLPHGFEYEGKVYTSLSEIAYAITGTRWNGWVFFGLKKRGSS
jgi:hypothetical protein